jgi:hypothetical protein
LVSIKGRNFLHQLRDYRRLRRTNSWFLEKDGIFFTSYATIGVSEEKNSRFLENDGVFFTSYATIGVSEEKIPGF